MGWLEERRQKKAEEAYQSELTKWQNQIDNLSACIKLAQTFNGEQSDQIILHSGEALYFYVTNCSLIEERAGPGHWTGKSSGFSIPVAHIDGSAIRYRIGASKGHFESGEPVEKAIDSGTTFITDTRVVYQGENQTREIDYSKLIAYNHDQQKGETSFSLSNRQKPITIHYGINVMPAFVFRLSLAMSHYKNSVPQLIQQLEQSLSKLQQTKPVLPNSTNDNQVVRE
jgi:uncharacterized protein YukE